MTAADFLGRLVSALDAAGIPYMLVGSFASMFHGEPRATKDLDVVIDPDRATIERLFIHLATEHYYLDADVARDALRRRSMFNVIDLQTGWKADLIVRKARPFSIEELSRRIPGVVEGVPCLVATREDTILSKLEWAKASGSERQLDDVRGIVAVSGDELDRTYIARWAEELGVADLWTAL